MFGKSVTNMNLKSVKTDLEKLHALSNKDTKKIVLLFDRQIGDYLDNRIYQWEGARAYWQGSIRYPFRSKLDKRIQK